MEKIILLLQINIMVSHDSFFVIPLKKSNVLICKFKKFPLIQKIFSGFNLH